MPQRHVWPGIYVNNMDIGGIKLNNSNNNNNHNNNSNKNKAQFVNIVKSHENTQPVMNSIVKTAAKITEELIQPTEKSDRKQDGIQHTKARLEESLKKKK